MNQNVFERLEAYRNDPIVVIDLARILDAADRRVINKARRAEYVEKLICYGRQHQHFSCLESIKAAPRHYGSNQFVPDPFQDLENNGLAICEYVGSSGLRPRTLSITLEGLEVLKKIEASTL